MRGTRTLDHTFCVMKLITMTWSPYLTLRGLLGRPTTVHHMDSIVRVSASRYVYIIKPILMQSSTTTSLSSSLLLLLLLLLLYYYYYYYYHYYYYYYYYLDLTLGNLSLCCPKSWMMIMVMIMIMIMIMIIILIIIIIIIIITCDLLLSTISTQCIQSKRTTDQGS